MSTIKKKTLLPIMLACAALLSVHQQAAAQTPTTEGVIPGMPVALIPPDNAQKREYGCSLGHNNESVTARVSQWWDSSGALYTRVTEVQFSRYPSAGEGSLSFTGDGLTQSGIPMDGQWHASRLSARGNPKIEGVMQRPSVIGCVLVPK